MAGGFKRGGFRAGGGGAFKKSYTKKRSTEDDADAPHATKKLKGDDEEEEDTAPFIPRLDTDDEKNPFVALNHSGKRRVTVSDFKGTTLVSIREYYVNDEGELKPGKKGISLSLDQYNVLLTAAPLLESVLSSKDLQVARPDYDAGPIAVRPAGNNDEEQQSAAKVDNDEDGE